MKLMVKPTLPEIYTLLRDEMNDAQKQKVLSYALQDTLGKDYLKERGISLSDSETGERLSEFISIYGLEYKKQFMAEQEETEKEIEMCRKRVNRHALLNSVILFIGGSALIFATYTAGYNTSKEAKPTTQCYHHTLAPEETLDNVITYFKTKDSTVSKNEVIAQNNLSSEAQFKAGQDITYCFDEK